MAERAMVRHFYHWKTVGLQSSYVSLCAGIGVPGAKKRTRSGVVQKRKHLEL